MTDHSRDTDLQALWQGQSRGEAAMSIDQVRTAARYLERRVGRRNRREYVAVALAVALFGFIGWLGPTMTIRAGAGLVVAASIFIGYQLRSRGGAAPLPADLALTSALDFYRAQLVRQRDLLRGVWWWGLLPAVPGLVILQIGQIRARPDLTSGHLVMSVLVAATFVGVHAVNLRVAARIQQRLDRLDAQGSGA